MGSVIFAQPLFLFGLLAVGLPVLIHLIHRQKRRRYRFSSLRFLKTSDRRSARRHRLVDLLVLLLRALLMALLALALSQPLVRPPGAEAGRFGKMALGIVIDDSMSMRRSIDNTTLFDRAIEMARRIVEDVPQEGEAFVLLTSGRTPAQLATPTSPPSNLAGLLDDLECSHGGRAASQSIHEAADLLRGGKFQNRVVVLISDLGANAFSDADSLDSEKLAESVGTIYVIDVGRTEKPNFAITDVRGAPASAFPGSPLTVRVEVACSYPPHESARVSLWVGEEKIAERDVHVAQDRPAVTAFEHRIYETGAARVSVRLEPDGLAADNVRYAVFDILPSVNAMILAPPEATVGDETLFLRTALNPLETQTTAGVSPVRTTVLNYLELRPDVLAASDVVFLIFDPSVSKSLLAQLEQYMKGGGTVIVFPSAGLALDPTGPARLKQETYAGFGVSGLWAAGEEVPVGIGETQDDHPVFSLLARSAPHLIGSTVLHRYIALDENAFDASSRVLARTEDGAPFLVERKQGAGQMLAFTTGCHPLWSDLPLRPLFLPLLYETLKYAQGHSDSTRSATVDTGFSVELPNRTLGGAVSVRDPSAMETQIRLGLGQSRLDYADTATPGFYSVDWAGAEGNFRRVVAVNGSFRESGPERVGREDLRAYFPESYGVEAETEPDKLIQRLRHSARGIALATPLLGLALLAFLGEAYLANALLKREPQRHREPIRDR